MKTIFLMFFACSQLVSAGGHSTSGGGGVLLFGKPMTFFTHHNLTHPETSGRLESIDSFLVTLDIANFEKMQIEKKNIAYELPHIFANIKAKTLIDLPALSTLITYVKNTNSMDALRKHILMNSLVPNQGRVYTDISLQELPAELYTHILKEYTALTKIKKNNLALFAVTDTQNKRTYLFPEFYKLSQNEQIAILLHENLWLAFPDTSYEHIVELESVFQFFLDYPEQIINYNALLTKKWDLIEYSTH